MVTPHPGRGFWQVPETVRALFCARKSGAPSTLAAGIQRQRQLHAAQTRLLYENANLGIVVTVVIAALLAYAQWSVIRHWVISAWLLYMVLVCVARFALVRRYRRETASEIGNGRWNSAFVAGTGLAAAGWGAAAIFLYPPDRPVNETFLVFVVGGVMLGGGSLLAARPAAFLTFLLPPGLLTALRLGSLGGEVHLMMGFLCALFTLATVATTWGFHRMIQSSFKLRFDNQDLIESLQTAKDHAEALNRDLEIRVNDRTAKLLEADQRKDEFLATLAHELRNPLAPIRFAVESLKAGAPPASAVRAREVIDRQVRQLVRLVDDLLDVSRITANKIHLRREPHDLARLMTTAAESIMPLAAAAEQQLDVRMPSTPIWVDGDGARLVQIFANVLSNAVKFTPRGGQIWFSAESQPAEALVRIRDTGIGIAADVLPRVFDMFQQAEPILERSAGGLGIGLTLARRLVEMHDGRIVVTSAGPGQGTQVEIRLPMTLAPAGPVQLVEPLSVADGRKLRVLIVEDNVDAAEMLDLLISELGHLTKVAHDGSRAITAAKEFVPDVVFMDIGLPVMNGYAVVRALRELPEFASAHFAAVTGWGQDEDRRKAREAGFDSHFTKPLSPAVLEELLAGIAQRARAGGEAASTPRTRATDAGYAS
ncbi:MAG TPA: ATP-binding protein [Vicinamibacterales bacterium]|nr:ATP-binding protein [Vicinamibacterales bacterium]